MKVMVTVKEVAELEDDFAIEGTRIDDKFFEYQLNEWDEYALEEAVQMKENLDPVDEVFCVTVGPERSEETIRMALAKGADRAVRIWDEELAGSITLDPRVTARLLGAVARQEDPDLILTGVMAHDDLMSATGLTLAQQLDYGWSAVVNRLDVDPSDRMLNVHRELEGGVDEVTRIEIPAVLTIQTGLNQPRYASLRGIRQARSKELTVLGLGDLGLDSGALESSVRLNDLREPETETETKLFEGSPSDQAAQLVDTLDELGVINQ